MYAENLEAAEEVIRRLFDPRRTYKKAYISPEIKLAYLQHYLESRWTEIVGENLARSCAIEKISGSELYVRTANSMLANELYMMQQLFLQKINSFLLGRVLIKKVYFHTGSFFRKQQQKEKQAEPPEPPAEYTKCPICGAQMRKGLDMCSICEREQREELRSKLGLHHLKVVFSPEQPHETQQLETPPPGRRSVPASVPWVPSVAGLLMGGAAVRDLIDGGGLVP